MNVVVPPPDAAEASALITHEAVRDLLAAMVDIRSPTGEEREMAEFMVARMRAAGLAADLQFVSEGRPNAVGHLRGTGEGLNLLFTGHMDTSYDGTEDYLSGDGYKPKAVCRDGWMWGLGAHNMKSGLAAAMIAAEAIARAGIRLRGDVSIAGVVGEIEKTAIEEFQGTSFAGYGVGTRHLVTHGVTADYAILAEPSALTIATANMGCIWVRISVKGTVSHAALSNRPNVRNAIRLMHELEAEIFEWSQDYEAAHVYMGERPNVTVAAIRGGAPWRLSRNPVSCSLYLDIRTVPGQTVDEVKRELRRLLRGFAERKGVEEPDLFFYVTDPAMVIDEESPVVDALGAAQKAVMGERPASTIRRPGSDAIHLASYGVPCVQFGPGGRLHPDAKSASMHAAGEHVLIDDVVTTARIFLATALDLCNRPAPQARAAGRG
ncbi:M20 family metallopeptidase [Faunimonas sp. B44]|uniref:M20 family metallopeptidase n=1 Tax=Faunimonas sp. B44 TaxID=3461493 RepID=UPI00404485A1